MASNAFEADVYQHIEAIKAANVYAAMSGSIEAVQPAEAVQRALDAGDGPCPSAVATKRRRNACYSWL